MLKLIWLPVANMPVGDMRQARNFTVLLLAIQMERRYERYNTAENAIDGLVEMFGSTLDSHHSYFYGSWYDKLYGYDEGKGWDYTYVYCYTTAQGEQWLACYTMMIAITWQLDVQSAYWGAS
jgi:hypothetical protein